MASSYGPSFTCPLFGYKNHKTRVVHDQCGLWDYTFTQGSRLTHCGALQRYIHLYLLEKTKVVGGCSVVGRHGLKI